MSKTKASSPEKFDVVVVERETRCVASVIGASMNLETGFYNARRRQETAIGRFNDRVFVVIVEAGKFVEGSVLPANFKTY